MLILFVLGAYLKTNIMWKHVIVGFNYESNRKVITLNSFIPYVAYRIYTWVVPEKRERFKIFFVKFLIYHY